MIVWDPNKTIDIGEWLIREVLLNSQQIMMTVFLVVCTVLGEQGVGILISMQDTEIDRLVSENLSTILSYGTNFMDIVCRDACDGHDVGRVSLWCLLYRIFVMIWYVWYLYHHLGMI